MNILLNALWGTSVRKWITSTCGAILGLAAVASQVIVPAYTYYELPVAASQRYVEKRIAPVEVAQANIGAAQSHQNVAIDQLLLFQLNQQLRDAQKDPAAESSPIVQQSIRAIQEQIAATQARIINGPK